MASRRKSSYVMALLLYSGAIQAASNSLEFFVATNGLPANPGTKYEPFGSIEQARDHIRSLIDDGLQSDVTVMVHGGTYRITNAISFGPEDTVSPTNHITYLAYPGEEPVISGGKPITGWEVSGPVWSVYIPEVASADWNFRELFVNGQRRPRARVPNEGHFRVLEAGPDKRTSFEYYADDLSAYTNLHGAELVFFHDWCVSRVEIDSINIQSNVVHMSYPVGALTLPQMEMDNYEPHPRYYIEDHIELLDSAGEWCLEDDGWLTYWPMPGEEIDLVSVIAPVATSLMECTGSAENGIFVENLHFQGITFSHCSWEIPFYGYAPYQAGSYEIRPIPPDIDRYSDRMPAAVRLSAIRNCSVSDGRFLHLGGSAISIRKGAQNSNLIGNEITDVAGNGIMVGEKRGIPYDEIDLSSETWNFWWDEHPEWLVEDTVVSNNYVHECGAVFQDCVGIWLGITKAARVSRNAVGNLPYTGISAGWMWNDWVSPCASNIVEQNLVSDVVQLLSDGGGIYTLGRQTGTVVRNNIVHTVHPTKGRSGNNGIFLDASSAEMSITSNIVYNVESNDCVRFNTLYTNTFIANTLVPQEGYSAFSRYPPAVAFVDNIEEDPDTYVPPNAEELGIGLCIVDADGNGLADAWETAYLGSAGQSPASDFDGDGADLMNEYTAGTHPLDPESVMRLGISFSMSSPVLDFETKESAGIGYRSMVRHYSIEQSPDLTHSSWTNVAGLEWIAPSNYRSEFHLSGDDENVFYRVLVTLDP